MSPSQAHPVEPQPGELDLFEVNARRGERVGTRWPGPLLARPWRCHSATLDVDLNVFVEPEGLGPVFEAFGTLGIAVDLERLIAVQGPQLDVAYVRQQMVAMMGEGDPRVQRWDELVASFMP